MGDRLQEIRVRWLRGGRLTTDDESWLIVEGSIRQSQYRAALAEVEALRVLLGEVLTEVEGEPGDQPEAPSLALLARIRAALGGGSDG